ncbi:MAG: Rieske 2Fe-2S domain-containing protein [Chloroflexota bacterium]
MAEYTAALKTREIKDGEMRGITTRGKEVLLARVAGHFYAASNFCPHFKGRLSEGTLRGTVVTCPRHASQFDLTDGHVVRWTNWSGTKLAISKLLRAPSPLQTYPVKIEGDTVMVEI